MEFEGWSWLPWAFIVLAIFFALRGQAENHTSSSRINSLNSQTKIFMGMQ